MAAWGGVVVLALAAVAPAFGQSDIIGIPVGATPPAVTLENLTGDTVSLARWVGKKPVLVEFWATWCPICEALLPRIEAAQQQYGDRVEFLVIAVAVNQSKSSVRRHIDRHAMPFRLLWDGSGAAVRAFQAPSTSYIVVLDRSGKVVYTGVGEDQDIEAALAKAVGGGRGR
jgi:peroxiredoxin